MSTEINDKLDEILARAEAATAGPWDTDTDDLATWINPIAYPQPIARMGSCRNFDILANADFIAAARSNVPALVKALRGMIKDVKIQCNDVTVSIILENLATILNASPAPGGNKR